MLTINTENRIEIENEFLALILNKNEILEIMQIQPKYLYLKENKKILQYAIECYEKLKYVDIGYIYEKYQDVDIDVYIELVNDTFWYKNAWEEQLKHAEESIVKFYKEDVIKFINEKLKRHEINYDEFMAKMKELDDIVLIDKTETLTIKEIVENIDNEKQGITFKRFKNINNMLKLVQGDFLIIGATTGAGKSGFMLNLMNDLMEDYQCIYFNMEMSKNTIYKRIISIYCGVELNYISKPRTSYESKLINEAITRASECKLIIEHQANDIKQIRSFVAKLKDKNKHTILFLDHLGLTKCDGSKNLYEQATEVAKQLRQMCLEYDCTIIGASQLNRSAYGSDEVSLNMLKDSGELENSASKVILLYRDKNSAKEDAVVDMNIDIAKNRDGVCGIVNMRYDKRNQVFQEI